MKRKHENFGCLNGIIIIILITKMMKFEDNSIEFTHTHKKHSKIKFSK